MEGLSSIGFLNVLIDAVRYEDMFNLVDNWLSDKSTRSHHIACINAFGVTSAFRDPRLASIYNGADIAGPDGMPFVYWIRWFHRLRCDRFYAPDIVLQLAERAIETDYTFYLYGGSPEVLDRMIVYLKVRFPDINIIGYRSPPFRELTAEEDRIVCDEINSRKPDILCVGLGTPKQDFWIDDHIDKIRGSVMISCGATFDFLAGRVKIAPKFIQRSGFEWLYRLLGRDFRRLWQRYTIMNVIFLWNFGLELLGIRVLTARRWKRRG